MNTWEVNTTSGAVDHFAICRAFWEYVGIWCAAMSMFSYAHLFLVCVQCLRAQYMLHTIREICTNKLGSWNEGKRSHSKERRIGIHRTELAYVLCVLGVQ